MGATLTGGDVWGAILPARHGLVDFAEESYGERAWRRAKACGAIFRKSIADYPRSNVPAMEGQETYVRFGYPPENGRSFNHATGRAEAGVSCFPAHKVSKGYVLHPIQGLFHRAEIVTWHCLDQIPAFEIAGRWAGTGSSNEPVLADVVVTERIARPEIGPIPWSLELWWELLFWVKLPPRLPLSVTLWWKRILNAFPDPEELATIESAPPGWDELWR
jgi:hypothetical protein